MTANIDTTNINTILTFLENVLYDDSDYLVTKEINKIIKVIESTDSDLLKLEVKEKLELTDYENALANVYEKLATKSSAANKKLFDLLIELDPLPNYEYKKRISSASKRYGISEWIQEKLVENSTSKDAILYYSKLLEHGFFPAKIDQFDGESRQEWAKRTMMGQPDNYNKIKSRVLTYMPEEEVRTIEDEQIQELENMYTKICSNRVDNTDDVTNTHNLDPDSDIIVFLIFGKIWCYEKKEIMKSIVNYKPDNLFHKWIQDEDSSDWSIKPRHVNPFFHMANFEQGYGGKKGKTSYIRLPIGPMGKLLIDITGIIKLLKYNVIPLEISLYDKDIITDSTITNVFNVTEAIGKERIGSTNTSFGVSETHGQNDVVQIFTIEPIDEDFDSGDSDLDSYISYYHEKLSELIDKIKFDEEIVKEAKDNKLPPSDILYNEIEKLDISAEVGEEETAKSYMTLFTDPDFVKNIPLNSPQFNRGDMVIVNIPNIMENLICIVKEIFRDSEFPPDRKVKWHYFATPLNSNNTSNNRIALLDETYIEQVNEEFESINEIHSLADDDYDSDNDSGISEDYNEAMRQIRSENRNDSDFIPFNTANSPVSRSLFGPDSPQESPVSRNLFGSETSPGSPPGLSMSDLQGDSLQYTPDSPTGPPPGLSMSDLQGDSLHYPPNSPTGPPPGLSMSDLQPNSPEGTPPPLTMPNLASNTQPRTPQAPQRTRRRLRIVEGDVPEDIRTPMTENDSDTEEELGFGGKKQTRTNKKNKKNKQRKSINKKHKPKKNTKKSNQNKKTRRKK